ncbi:methyl-accepting chemotaxis protein [Pleionea sp. CnH1-48]|uniref:HAMP domain-containing methyl-accepting chemotaxis protein n=1 Tax=Pleionea sp. CnH1-48 TaxID=2954494 RepID=UPI00209745F7|nr:methyl-accepting chemotaxis protein [Pleionea sp. CnH1-48]
MLNLTVTGRIILGYTVVLFLSAAMLFSGISGISNISANFSEVVSNTIPMAKSSREITSSFLQANILLVRYQNTQSSSELSAIEKQYQTQKSVNDKALKSLRRLTEGNNSLKKVLSNIATEQQKIFSNGDKIINDHRNKLTAIGIANEQSSFFSDMGDEILSYSIDLEGVSNSSQSRQLISDITESLDSTTIQILETAEMLLKMAVLESMSEVQGSLSDIENQLTLISNDTQIKNSSHFKSLTDSFALYKAASSKLIRSHMKRLDFQKQVDEDLAAIDAASINAMSELDKLNATLQSLTEQVESETLDSIDSSKASLILFAFIALVSAIIISYFVIRSISQPLNSTVNTIHEIAKGDLSVKFDLSSDDELGKLVKSMQNLVDALCGMLSEINSNSEQLAATAEQSANISQQTTSNINRQKQQTDIIVTSIEQMSAAVNEVSQNSSQTLHQVESAYTEVTKGEAILNQNISRIQSLANDIDDGANVIQKLNEDCTNIGSVLDVIQGVAEQTNLLALNAAIEAARAGEQGRGFAVVADEVRTLASTAQDSTTEIQEIIQRLQHAAREAVAIMTKSRQEAQSSVESIQEAGDMLAHIANAVNQIKDMSHQIASAAEQQAVSTKDQQENVSAIAAFAEETSAGAQENQAASQELARMAETQRALVSQFKL